MPAEALSGRMFPGAEFYLRTSIAMTEGAMATYSYPEDLRWRSIDSPALGVNSIFYQDRQSPYGHRFMFDEHLLRAFLEDAGFVGIRRTEFQAGRDQALLIDSKSRWVEFVAMESVRP
jgi:hypothetical protein